MKTLIFARRNFLIFFRDRSSVFFSLLSILIIVALYVLFLGEVWQENMKDIPGINLLMDSWIISGLLAVMSFTTAMGAFGTMVDDKAKKVFKDFYSAPVRRTELAGGYILGAFFVSFALSLFSYLLCQGVLLLGGGSLPGFLPALGAVGLILIACLVSNSLIFFILSFVKTPSAFATISTIVGTLMGFLTGIYMPVGVLPRGVQYFIKVFPVSHAALLLRRLIMAPYLEASFAGAPPEAAAEFKSVMGVEFFLNGRQILWQGSLAILIASILIFSALSAWRISKKAV